MNLTRLAALTEHDHIVAVELEDRDYGGRSWDTMRDSEVNEHLKVLCDAYDLSDIDHSDKCECGATHEELVFLYQWQALAAG